jgi:adenylate cyclase, class 2
MHEIETKILEVETNSLIKNLEALGAEKTQEVVLTVDWFSLPGLDKDHQPWFLRVRSYSTGKIEVTWKGKHEIEGAVRKVLEVNVFVDNHEKMKMLFEAIGLFCYAHQEKKRISWKLENVQFDLDTYPGMPAYLEIEAGSEKEISDMVKKLNLEKHETWNDGEKILIEEKYKINWCDMRF